MKKQDLIEMGQVIGLLTTELCKDYWKTLDRLLGDNRDNPIAKPILTFVLAGGLVTTCVGTPPPTPAQKPSLATNNQPVAASPSPTPQKQVAPTSQALPSCGDTPEGSNDIWYGVVVAGTRLEEMRSLYCKDAVVITKTQTGQTLTRVASFRDRAKAVTFAKKIKGEVEDPPTPEVAESPEPIETPAYQEPAQSIAPTRASGSGRCLNPDDVDSRGRRCGRRAASAR